MTKNNWTRSNKTLFPWQMNGAHGLYATVTSLRHHDQLHVQQNSCLPTEFHTMLYRNKEVWLPNYTYPSQVSDIIHKNLHYSNKTSCSNKCLHETTISGNKVKSLSLSYSCNRRLSYCSNTQSTYLKKITA